MTDEMKLDRRAFLKGAGASALSMALANALAACAKAPAAQTISDLGSMEGELVPLREILSQMIPEQKWREQGVEKSKVVIVVDKEHKLFGLFVLGKLERVGVAGTAKTSEGYVTSNGRYPITRLEGSGYTSKKYPGAKMDYASFFGDTGRAIHASSNYLYRHNQETGMYEWMILLDNSHGCVNVTDEDALAINNALRQYGSGKGEVIVL